jgi:phage repressor protein C with HTH and peptisase S24 domain
MNKPDTTPTKKKATAKKKPSKAATKAASTKAANAATKRASSSASMKIPPRTLSQPSITQTLAEIQEAVTEVKESESGSDLRKMRADMGNYFGDTSMDFLNSDEESSVASEAKSDYSGGILEVYNSPDASSQNSFINWRKKIQ